MRRASAGAAGRRWLRRKGAASAGQSASRRVPLVLAGGLGWTLATGRTLDYLKAGDQKRKLCSLYLSIMDRMGLKLSAFGDARERLAGI